MNNIVIFLIFIICVLIIGIVVVARVYTRGSPRNEHPHAAPAELLEISDLREFVQRHGSCAVVVHAEWCSHCKKLIPVLERVLGTSKSPIVCGKLDGSKHPGEIEAHGVQGFPTLLRFENGKISDRLEGAQQESRIREFIR